MAGDIAGAQAQLLSAAELSLWARTSVPKIDELDAALWKHRKLVRAWCMRRTMFLLPSEDLAVFVRGTARRSEYNLRLALARGVSEQQLDRLFDVFMEALNEPRSRSDVARFLKTRGYAVKPRAGGGWGDSREVPFVGVGSASFSVGFLLHALGARDAICTGPSIGNESTYVRADRWLPHWKDVRQDRAEEELLLRYLRAYGPATVTDFALWMGLYVRDARPIWSRGSGKMAQVDVDGQKADLLEADLPALERARVREPSLRLLPFFDSFLLGHKSHLSVVDEGNRKKVYRPQGWVSPVVLLNGRVLGVWSYSQRRRDLEVCVTPFSRLSPSVSSMLQKEASDLGRFLGCSSVNTAVA